MTAIDERTTEAVADFGGVPCKADGSPGELCAGWAARRLHFIQTLAREAC